MAERTHLAELNIGRLVAPTDDPRVGEFMAALDRINSLGKRMPGFVWMMEGADPAVGNTDTKLDADPRFVANLTVWTDAESLERFVYGTVHRRFYERRSEWFEMMRDLHFVMWHVAEGHRPTVPEGRERLAYRERHGDTPHAFGWSWLRAADRPRLRTCGLVAAE